MSGSIDVRGATTHNLKAVDCRVPHGKVTLVTGPSGAGKSSLAFDTIYAEAQRRFIESMSTYARQFLEQMERPPVVALEGVLPSVALAANNSVKNARSTVGTITEVYDVLRLIFAHLGQVQCSSGHGHLVASTSQEAADVLIAQEGEELKLLAPLRRPAKEADAKLRELVRQGYGRVLVDGELERLGPKSRWLKKTDPLYVVVGRFKAHKRSRARLAAAIEEAYRLTGGGLEVEGGSLRYLGRRLTCGVCGETSARPQPALFSFNSPLGACPTCQGFGRVIGVDRERVIPEPHKTLAQKPIAAWNSPAYEKLYQKLWDACLRHGVPLDVPWRDLDENARDFVWRGRGFRNIERFFAWLERRNYRVHIRVLLSRYRAYEPCRRCGGKRLRPESLRVTVKGADVSSLSRSSVEDLREWAVTSVWESWEQELAEHLLEELRGRLETLHRVGLDYLTLDRQARTLSGGEAQRIQLASALGSGLTSTLYVLDEPTIGLHPQDSQRLVDLLRDLAGQGNTVLVVEHDRTLIEGADHVIDLGPGAGEHGGEVVAEGTLDQILASPDSLTALYLQGANGSLSGEVSSALVGTQGYVGIRGARENNLKGLDIDIPLGCLVAVTGVSGSGKTTLVQRVLHDNFQRGRGVVEVEPGRCDSIEGADLLEDIVLVDQRPLGRSSRSNPVTYIKAYDDIRKLYASMPRAQRDGITAGHFSFNVDKGRCEECEGTGQQQVDMQFMAAVRVTCDGCQGHRFRCEILEVTYQGRNISECLDLTVDAAMDFFAGRQGLCRRLQALVDVGLGYLRLGQSTATLSGGEAQRLKLATFLRTGTSKKRSGTLPRLFIFDEPTTGLHMADIDLLHQTLRRLIDRGHGVIVVEHSLDLVDRADWILDLGPGGGEHGGEILYAGAIDDFLAAGSGPTAVELRVHREKLGRAPLAAGSPC
ncbi:MAG: excinuclease ABC subunit UvrA [Acidobacteriota bacterium]|nr:excinuclease ABC subunit UvrA [Acidobacteriota bacterium]